MEAVAEASVNLSTVGIHTWNSQRRRCDAQLAKSNADQIHHNKNCVINEGSCGSRTVDHRYVDDLLQDEPRSETVDPSALHRASHVYDGETGVQ